MSSKETSLKRDRAFEEKAPWQKATNAVMPRRRGMRKVILRYGLLEVILTEVLDTNGRLLVNSIHDLANNDTI